MQIATGPLHQAVESLVPSLLVGARLLRNRSAGPRDAVTMLELRMGQCFAMQVLAMVEVLSHRGDTLVFLRKEVHANFGMNTAALAFLYLFVLGWGKATSSMKLNIFQATPNAASWRFAAMVRHGNFARRGLGTATFWRRLVIVEKLATYQSYPL